MSLRRPGIPGVVLSVLFLGHLFGFGEGVNGASGVLKERWRHTFGYIWWHVYEVGISPGVADLGYGSPALEVASGSEEYFAKPAIPGEWYCFDAAGTVLWSRNTTNDESRSSVNIADITGDGTREIAGSTTSGDQMQMMGPNGDFRWRFVTHTSDGGYYNNPSSPALVDVTGNADLEFVQGSLTGYVYCLDGDLSDGVDEGVPNNDGDPGHFHEADLLWSTLVGSVEATVTVIDADGNGVKEVFVGTTDGTDTFHCLNAATGAVVWTRAIGPVYSSAAAGNVDDDAGAEVIVGAMGDGVYPGGVYCFNGTTGATKWFFPVTAGVMSSPAVGDTDADGNGDVVFGGLDGKVYGLNARTGALRWATVTGDRVVSSPALARRCSLMERRDVYVGSDDGYLYLLSGTTGEIIDKLPVGAKIHGGPIVADIDGDHNLDILFHDWAADLSPDLSGDRLWCLRDTGSCAAPYAIEWGLFRRDNARTGFYPWGNPLEEPGPPYPVLNFGAHCGPDNTVVLSWSRSPSKDVASYRIYTDGGTGTIDYSAPIATVSHPQTTWTSPALPPGTFHLFAVRTVDTEGLEETNTSIVVGSDVGQEGIHAALKVPTSGQRVLYEVQLIMAKVESCAPVDPGVIAGVRFEYRLAGTSGPWTAMNAMNSEHPNPDLTSFGNLFYATHWDIQGINNPPITTGTYEIRAVALYRNGTEDAHAPSRVIEVVDHNPDRSTAGGTKTEQTVYQNSTNSVLALNLHGPESLELTLSQGALQDAVTDVSITLTSDSTGLPPAPSGDHPLGSYGVITLSNGQHALSNLAKVKIWYKDENGDGFIDGTDFPEYKLKIYAHSDGATAWEPSLHALINTSEKWVEGEFNHFSSFGLFGSSADSGGSSGGGGGGGGGCGSVGLDLLGFSYILRLIRRRCARS